MIHYQKIQLMHANLKKPLHIVAGTVAGYHHSDKAACTLLYTNAGIFPVLETPEQIDAIIFNIKQPTGQETKSEQQQPAV